MSIDIKHKNPENCINPWYQYGAILVVISLTVFAIFEVGVVNASDEIVKPGRSGIGRSLSEGHILIAATGSTKRSDVALQFEESPNFIIVNAKTNNYRYYVNNWNSFHANSVKRYIIQNNVEAVITGTMNIDTYNKLHSINVATYTGVTGTVQDAVKSYNDHKLIPANYAQDVQGNSPAPEVGTTATQKRVVL